MSTQIARIEATVDQLTATVAANREREIFEHQAVLAQLSEIQVTVATHIARDEIIGRLMLIAVTLVLPIALWALTHFVK